MSNTITENMKKVRSLVNEWLKEGENEHPIPLSRGIHGVPLHPEFIYRKTGAWKGWNDFLGINEEGNYERDLFEDTAWSLYKEEHS